jgi:hypothetical protein
MRCAGLFKELQGETVSQGSVIDAQFVEFVGSAVRYLFC